ncbi:MAG: GerMN domain-containing protein [Candidatus Paceibacterota bacterium]
MSRTTYISIVIVVVFIILGIFLYSLVFSTPPLPEISKEKTVTFSVFFSHKNISAHDCSQVLPIKRTIPYTTGVATEALQQLFQGPTPQELQQGYTSALVASSSPLIRISIYEGTAYVDLHDIRKTQTHISSSCGMGAFISQVTNTLTQFSTIQKVIFAINGNPQIFYDWIQMGCSLENEYCNPTQFLIAGIRGSLWTPYTDTQKLFTLSYPSLFTKAKSNTSVLSLTPISSILLTHRIPTPHCVLSEKCTPFTTNIQVQLSVLNAPLSQVAQAIASSTAQEPQPFHVAEKTGVFSYMGAEGEGLYEYAIPLNTTHTLFITRIYIDEASIITYKSAPLFIPFEDQKKLFSEILNTLKIF